MNTHGRFHFLFGLLVILLFVPGLALAAVSPLGGPIDMEQAQAMLLSSQSDDIMGIYEMSKRDYEARFLVVSNDYPKRPNAKYIAVVISSTNDLEKSGYVKFWLSATDVPAKFRVEYLDYSLMGTCDAAGVALLTPRKISIRLKHSVANPSEYVKIYP